MRSRLVVIVLAVTVVLGATRVARCQGTQVMGPEFDGVWTGPFPLGALINDPLLVAPALCWDDNGQTICPKVWAEIAHAVVLPYPLGSQVL